LASCHTPVTRNAYLRFFNNLRERLTMNTFRLATMSAAIIASLPAFAAEPATTTPIKHVIVVVGENVTFDTLFATYVPPAGESVKNLLSEGIVKSDGTPGPNYRKAVQREATNRLGRYTIEPTRLDAYAKLPQPTLTGAYNPETLLPWGNIPDPRFATLNANGPFQITKFVPYASGLGDPAHRFFQMWQQTGGTNERHDLFAWVAMTVGTGGDTKDVTSSNTGQGGELMGFFNIDQGDDARYFKQLAQEGALSDNFHQSVMGGTGANFFAIATGDAAVYRKDGKLATPPANQIENPDPQLHTDNFYIRDGYQGGSYVKCADADEPGVGAIQRVLREHDVKSNCEPGTYYLVNNYEPPYTLEGKPKALGATDYVYPPQTVPTIGELLSQHNVSWKWFTGGREEADLTNDPLYPKIYAKVAATIKEKSGLPQTTPNGALEPFLTEQAILAARSSLYNTIGDPLNASVNVVGNSELKKNLQGLTSFYADVKTGTLPAVSFVVPKNLDSGHPGYSVPHKYELFLEELITKVKANPAWNDTAIIITTDEGGGYFDSGRIQPLDFFGDGPRIPLIVISPYAKTGHVDHVYHDHASILKFIEHNWKLPPLSKRSRDNLPNAVFEHEDGYIPENGPAIGDLTTLFNFPSDDHKR
jgi:phospholipase C